MRPFLKYQLPALVWSVAIFALSAVPEFAGVRVPLRADKIIHGTIYFTLCLLVWRAIFFQSRFPILRKRAILFAFLFTCAYGIIDELHQIYVPGRTPDFYDAVADGTGALLFVLFYWVVVRRRVAFDKK